MVNRTQRILILTIVFLLTQHGIAQDDHVEAVRSLNGTFNGSEEINRWGLRSIKSDGKPLAELTDLSSLQNVRFGGRSVTNQILSLFQGCKELKGLSFRGSENVTDGGFLHLKSMTKLEDLDCGGSQVTDGGLAHLSDLTTMRRLKLSGLDINGSGFTHLRKLTRLEVIHLAETQVNDAGLSHLKQFAQLRALELHGVPITDDGLAHLESLKKLVWLSLASSPAQDSQLTDAGLDHLGELRDLRFLHLGGTKVTDRGLAKLVALNNVEWLGLGFTYEGITDEGLAIISEQFPKLQTLGLLYTSVTDDGLRHLRGLASLEQLDLSFTKIQGGELNQLARLPKLKWLGLGGPKITDASLAKLASLIQLKDLWIVDAPLTDASIPHLRELKHLRGLRLRGKDMTLTASAVQELKDALPKTDVRFTKARFHSSSTPSTVAPDFITSDPQAVDYWPSFSPDGQSVLFSRKPFGERKWELFVVPTTGGVARRLNRNPLPVSATRSNWSTKSNVIAFTGGSKERKHSA